MPNPNNRIAGEQWDTCERCGSLFPMSSLTKQKGALVCTRRCVDDLEVERMPRMIERILSAGVDQEGVDHRVYDRSFFDGFDEEVS